MENIIIWQRLAKSNLGKFNDYFYLGVFLSSFPLKPQIHYDHLLDVLFIFLIINHLTVIDLSI